MKKKAFNYILFTLAFFSLFFSGKAYAYSTEVFGNIDYVGNTTVDFPAPQSNCSNNMHKGSYDTGSFVSSYDGISCPASTTSATGFLEGGWNNGAAVTDDGNYYIKIFDQLGQTGDYYYFKATRVNGNWYSQNEFSSTTRITKINWPIANMTASSTAVNFNYNYFASGADGYDTVGTQIKDTSVAFDYTPKELSISSSGYANYSQTYVLNPNHFHLWRAYIKNSSNQSFIYSSWQGLEVVGASASSSPLVLNLDMTQASTSGGFMEFLNVPNLLQTRIPFAYFFQLTAIMENLDQYSSTTIPSGAFDWKWASGTPAEKTIRVDLFSTTTISTFLSPTLTSLLRNLMVAVTYFSTMWFLYHEAKRKHLLS